MQGLRKVIKKVAPKLRAIEENPTVDILKENIILTQNPFDTSSSNTQQFLTFNGVACIYSEEAEIVPGPTGLTTTKSLYLYIHEDDLIEKSINGGISLKDRFNFQNVPYKPDNVQNLFGLWKIRISKIN